MTKKIAIVGLGIGSVYKEQAEQRGYLVDTVDSNPAMKATFRSSLELARKSDTFYDLIIICTPNDLHALHFEHLRDCSDNFIIEKPGFKDSVTLKEILENNPQKFITIAKNNIYREWPDEKLFLTGLNSLDIFWINKNRVPKPGSWFTKKGCAWGGVSRDLLPHLLHMYWALFKNLNSPVFSEANQVYSLQDLDSSEYGEIDPNGTYDVDDHVCVKFTEAGTPINLISSWKDVTGQESRIRIKFNDGSETCSEIELGLCQNECYGKMMDDIMSANSDRKKLLNDIDYWTQSIIDCIPVSDKFPKYMHEIVNS